MVGEVVPMVRTVPKNINIWLLTNCVAIPNLVNFEHDVGSYPALGR